MRLLQVGGWARTRDLCARLGEGIRRSDRRHVGSDVCEHSKGGEHGLLAAPLLAPSVVLAVLPQPVSTAGVSARAPG